jgi:hypothetical protein
MGNPFLTRERCHNSCTKEVVMTKLSTQHWHVGVTFPGYRDGYEDQPFEDVDGALDYANQTRDAFRQDGHVVTEVDRPDDDAAGVIQRYRATEEEDETVALVEVRPCHHAGCLLGQPADSLLDQFADSPPLSVESYPADVLNIGGPRLAGRRF